ncbi:MAG: alpha/beta hydrolase [Ketobacter sp.]|nr:alpha/beta hydrolase [Ketobacter sp.]
MIRQNLMGLLLISLQLFCLMLTAGCSTRPVIPETQLQQRSDYREEFIVNAEGMRLFTRTWEPATAAKANVIILHGTSLHGGLYANTAKHLVANGYRVYAIDMQGWGYSEGLKGCGYVESFDAYSYDVKLVLQMLRKRYPQVNNYLLGESLGGAVAMHTAVKYEFLVNGVITSGVGYKPSLKLMGIRAPEVVNDFTLTSAKWFWMGLSSFPAIESDLGLRMAVEDDALQDRLLDDPVVCHDWLPGAYISTTLEAGDYLEPRLRYITVPMLLLHGKDDVLVPVSSSQEIYDQIDSRQKRMLVYDSPHTVLLENKWPAAAEDIVTFLDYLN